MRGDTSVREITDEINNRILHLQYCVNNRNLTTLFLMIPHDTAASLLYVGSVLKHLHALTAHPTAMIIPDIKAKNALFHKLLPMIKFEPSLAAIIQKILVGNLLQYFQDVTSTYFTTKHQYLQDDPYILQAI